jgi:hypothetical protein
VVLVFWVGDMNNLAAAVVAHHLFLFFFFSVLLEVTALKYTANWLNECEEVVWSMVLWFRSVLLCVVKNVCYQW